MYPVGRFRVVDGEIVENTIRYAFHRTPIQVFGSSGTRVVQTQGPGGSSTQRAEASAVGGIFWFGSTAIDVADLDAENSPFIDLEPGLPTPTPNLGMPGAFGAVFRYIKSASGTYESTTQPTQDLTPLEAVGASFAFPSPPVAPGVSTAIGQALDAFWPPCQPSGDDEPPYGAAVVTHFDPAGQAPSNDDYPPGTDIDYSSTSQGFSFTATITSGGTTTEIRQTHAVWPVHFYPHFVSGYDGNPNPAAQPGPCDDPTEEAVLLVKCDGTQGVILYRKTLFDTLGIGPDEIVKIGDVCYKQQGAVPAVPAVVRTSAIASTHPSCLTCQTDPVPCWILERCDGMPGTIKVAVSEIDLVAGEGSTLRIDGDCWTRVIEVVSHPDDIAADDIEGRFLGCAPCEDRPKNVRFDPCTGFGTGVSIYVDQDEYDALPDPPVVVSATPSGGPRNCYRLAARDVEVGNPMSIDTFADFSSYPNCPTCYGVIEPPGPTIRPGIAITAPPGAGGPAPEAVEAIEREMAKNPMRRCIPCGD